MSKPVDRISQNNTGNSAVHYGTWQLKATRNMGNVVARKFQAHVDPNDTVVDFGCGAGDLLSSLKCRTKIGIDPNDTTAQYARDKCLTFRALDAVDDGIADVVISHHSLEHCLHPLIELQQVRRVLKPDGLLLLIVPIDDWRTQRRYDKADVNYHLYTWTPLLLGHLLSEAGLQLRSIKIEHRAWPPGSFYVNRVAPTRVFDAICTLWSYATKAREIFAVSQK